MTVLTEPKDEWPKLSLVFPVFDEAPNVDRVIESACKTGEQLVTSFEIVVVDDGSRDGSAKLIDRWSARDPRVRAVRHASNIGYGAALRSGLTAARGELIFFSDADLQFDLAELANLLAHSREFDIVAGYRSPRRDPWPRVAIARTWAMLVRSLFGLRIRDIDCAFKLFHRRVIAALPLSSVGAFINTELLVRAQAAGFRIHQIPVSHRRRRYGQQTGARPRVVIRAGLELMRLYRTLPSVRSSRAQSSRTGSFPG
ncbi:glycosyltransferase family 2 protein [Myxococcota bacterium]|nr:glycosyltransferase family 2 protein [Myxococcota bacterium]